VIWGVPVLVFGVGDGDCDGFESCTRTGSSGFRCKVPWRPQLAHGEWMDNDNAGVGVVDV
jgi:hypothetical protein